MKISVFVYEYPPKIVGGLGTYAAEITRKFVLKDNDVTVLTMNDDEGTMPTREIWRGIEIHRPLHIDISDSLPDVIAEPGQVHRRKPHCGSTSGLIAHRSCHALSGVP